MSERILKNNEVLLIGKAKSKLTVSHTVYGETFYLFYLEVERLSNVSDVLPVIVSERLLSGFGDVQEKRYKVIGQFRSYNQSENGKNKLMLSVFTTDIKEIDETYSSKIKNSIYLNGYICKSPVYRTTPFGREITDLLVAVNRAYHKSDYIPCITWGRNARYAKELSIGEPIEIWGRVQQRNYEKKEPTGEVVNKVAYEVSISRMQMTSKINE